MCLFCMSSASLDIGQTEWKVGGRGPSVTHRYEQQCMRMSWPVCVCVCAPMCLSVHSSQKEGEEEEEEGEGRR